MTASLEFLLSISATVAVVLAVSQQAAEFGHNAALANAAEKLEAWKAVAECNLVYFAPSLEAREIILSPAVLSALEDHCLAETRLTAGGVLVVGREGKPQ